MTRISQVRYRLYGEWEREDERIPMLLAARQTAKVWQYYFSLNLNEREQMEESINAKNTCYLYVHV